jgi:hypothetical protein
MLTVILVAHEVEETSRPSPCADDDDIAGAATPDDLCHNRRGCHPVDRRPCENEVVAMAFGYHRASVAAASPDGDGVVEMVSDCQLAHGEGNSACNHGVGGANDDGNGGRASPSDDTLKSPSDSELDEEI